MRCYFFLFLFLALASSSFGQTPSPSASPENRRDFGSSLKQYGKKKQRDSQAKPKSSDADDEEVIRVKTDLVINDVLVTNQKGNVIVGLQRDDFTVSEDGVPQKVETFSFGERASIPRSVVLIIDCSMQQGPYLKKSIEAAKVLVDKLAPQDKMAIVTNDLKLRVDFTSNKILLKNSLDSLNAAWEWNIEFDTLLAVLNEMFTEENRQRIVIVQGDGAEIIWLKPDKDSPYPVSYSTLERSGLRYTGEKAIRKFGFSEVKEALERSRATIYQVIVGEKFLGLSKEEQLAQAKVTLAESNKFFGGKDKDLPAIIREYQYAEAERKTAGQTAMFKVAELSGGYADFLERPEDAESVYAGIFTVIKNRYILGYYPTNRNRDGKRRAVRIEVRGHPEYTVTGRKAYVLQ